MYSSTCEYVFYIHRQECYHSCFLKKVSDEAGTSSLNGKQHKICSKPLKKGKDSPEVHDIYLR